MTDAVLVQIITTFGVVLVAGLQLIDRQKIKRIDRQTTNSHGTQNLRDDIDTAKASSASAARAAGRAEEYCRDIDESVRAVQHSLERHTGLITGQIEHEAKERKWADDVLEQALTKHLNDCEKS